MRPILAGIETEYGLLVEGRGAEDQVDESKALVRSYPGECLSTWNYRYESPRSDLRGFKLEQLAVDPIDEQFDAGRAPQRAEDLRSDRILTNGARFYNDHGHPEYATPECFSLRSLALHDRYGESAVLSAAARYAAESDQTIHVYKNNTDFHGASYGTHESYLVPRSIGFERLYEAVLPMLVVRQILTGSGKVGSESGRWVDFQLSQRADFFTEPLNAETLYRRPIFNTRDECHADPEQWIRLHVISGDANMMPHATARKVGLVKLAIGLAEAGHTPPWKFRDAVESAKSISRDLSLEFKIELQGRSWTTGYEILESYFAAAEQVLDLPDELKDLIVECRQILEALRSGEWRDVSHQIDWAAKRYLLEHFMEEEGGSWKDSSIRSLDLEYHNIDPEAGLYHALEGMGHVRPYASDEEIEGCTVGNQDGTRALARSVAVTKFADYVHTACWKSITFKSKGKLIECDLKPDMMYSSHLYEVDDVETFINILRGTHD